MTQPVDRLGQAIAKLFEANLPQLKYYVPWEFTVKQVHTTAGLPPITVDLVSLSQYMPNLVNVPLWSDAGGNVAEPTVGSIVRVAFANGDSTKPMIIGLDQTAPTKVHLAGGGTAVARVGDTVQISIAQWNAASPTAPNGSVTISSPMNATIQTGSAVVQSA